MPTKTLSAEELARLAKEKADNKAADAEAKFRQHQINRLQEQIIKARAAAELVRKADAANDRLNKQFLRSYERLPRTIAEMQIRGVKVPSSLSIRYAGLTQGKQALEQMYASRALGAGISASMGGISKAAAIHQAMLGKGISTAFGEIGQAARAKEALGKGISHMFSEIGKVASRQQNVIGKGMTNLFGGITKAAMLQKTAMDKGLNNLFKGIGQAVITQQKQSEAMRVGIGRLMKGIFVAAGLQESRRLEAEAILNAPAPAARAQGTPFISRGGGRAGRIFRNLLVSRSMLRNMAAGVAVGDLMSGGGGGFIGPPATGAMLGGYFGGPMGAAVGAGAGIAYDVGLGLYDLYKAGRASMHPAANALEAISQAGRVTGIPYNRVYGMYGGTPFAPYTMSPYLSKLGVSSPLDYANILSSYGMPYRANTAVGYSALASQAKYLGFMGAPDWAGAQQRLLGMGYGSGAGGLENMMTMFADAIKKGLKGIVPPPQTFEGINKYLGMIAQTGQVMPLSRAIRLATQGITSANPALRTGLAQATAGATWSGMLGGIAGNPMQFTALMSAVYKATGSTLLTSGNVNKTLRSLGLPTHRFTKREAGVLNMMARMNPALAAGLLGPMGISGELIPSSLHRSIYTAFKNMGMSDAEARNAAIGFTTNFMPAGLTRTGTLNYFGVRAGAISGAPPVAPPLAALSSKTAWWKSAARGMKVDLSGSPYTTIGIGGRPVLGTVPSGLTPMNVPASLAKYREAEAALASTKLNASNIALTDFVTNINSVNVGLQNLIATLSNLVGGPIGGPGGIGRPGSFGASVPYPLGSVGSGSSMPVYPPGTPALPTGGGSTSVPPAVLGPFSGP